GYSSASCFPICFELPAAEKARLLHESAERRFADFLESARLLAPRLTVPFANGMRYLEPRPLWKNVSFSSADQAVRALPLAGRAGAMWRPGDRILADGSLARQGDATAAVAAADELAAIAAHARAQAKWLADLSARQPEPKADIVERFRAHLL